MLICKKDFQQYKKGDRLPDKLNIDIVKILIRDGFAEFAGRNKNAIVVDYIKRTKDNPKKNYMRKPRTKKKE